MARGKFKGKPTGERTFSSEEELAAGTSAGRPMTFKKKQVKKEVKGRSEESIQQEEDEDVGKAKHKGPAGLIEIENPNLAKPKNVKAKDTDVDRTADLSRRQSEELENQRSRAHYMRLQDEKTEKATKDLERLTLVRQQREEAAKKREEEKARKEERKPDARK